MASSVVPAGRGQPAMSAGVRAGACRGPGRGIRLVVQADDFGSSRGVNAAVLRAHREGILTGAGLMVTGDAAEEAAGMARENPSLGVGLHLALACARSLLGPVRAPGLADSGGRLASSPVAAGFRYFLRPGLRRELAGEIEAQMRRFVELGLAPGHLDGHCNLHLHPTVLGILRGLGPAWGLQTLRLTRDPLRMNLRLARGRWGYRVSHALVFGVLSALARPSLARAGVTHVDRVFGLLQNDRMDEGYLLRLIARLGDGTFEVYAHPDEGPHGHETEALCSPRVRAMVAARGIRLVRYADLAGTRGGGIMP